MIVENLFQRVAFVTFPANMPPTMEVLKGERLYPSVDAARGTPPPRPFPTGETEVLAVFKVILPHGWIYDTEPFGVGYYQARFRQVAQRMEDSDDPARNNP